MREATRHEVPNDEPRRLTTAESNELQRYLISRGDEDAAEWILRHAGDFRDLVENDPELRELIFTDRQAALDKLEDRLEQESGGNHGKSAVNG